jgi:hemolysin activation/secretion protein
MRHRCVLLIAVLCVARAAFAQTPLDIERAQQQNQQLIQRQQDLERQQRELEQSRQRTPSGRDLRTTTPEVPIGSGKPCTNVNDIWLDGATLLDDAVRAQLIAPYLGKCLSLGDINRLIGDITNHYVGRGYVTTRVYIPQQDLASGRLELKVVEGRIQSLRIDPPGSGSLATAFPGLTGGLLNLRDLEQGIDQLNRLSSNSAKIDIEPGDDPGASQIVINNETRKRWIASAGIDNSGAASTGYNMVSGSLNVDNLFGLNDFLNVNVRHSEAGPDSARNSNSGGLYWNMPYGYWNFSTAINAYDYKSLVQGQVSSFVTDGHSNSQMLRADRLVFRNQSIKWGFTGGITFKQTENFIADTKIDASSADLTIVDFGTNVTWIQAGTLISLNAGVAAGINAFGATKDDSTRPPGAPQAQYEKLTYGGSLLKSFDAGTIPLSWQTSLVGQYSQDHLYGTEQISIGNLFTVRGFRKTNLPGKTGFYVRNDFGMPLPLQRVFGAAVPSGQIKPYLGYDFGNVNGVGSLQGWTAGVAVSMARATFQLAWSQPISMPSLLPQEHGWLYASLLLNY